MMIFFRKNQSHEKYLEYYFLIENKQIFWKKIKLQKAKFLFKHQNSALSYHTNNAV